MAMRTLASHASPARRNGAAGKPKLAAKKRRAAASATNAYISTHDSVGFIAREVYRAFARSLQVRIAREGVTIGMWFVLRMLWDEDGLTQRELSDRVGINGPTMVAAINAMERAGLVERVPNTADRRKTNVHLTPRGRALKPVLWPMAADVLALAFRGIKREEIRVVATTLLRMKHNLERDA